MIKEQYWVTIPCEQASNLLICFKRILNPDSFPLFSQSTSTTVRYNVNLDKEQAAVIALSIDGVKLQKQ